jgi:hypothetical protein
LHDWRKTMVGIATTKKRKKERREEKMDKRKIRL